MAGITGKIARSKWARRAIGLCVVGAAVPIAMLVTRGALPPKPTMSLRHALEQGNIEEVESNLHWRPEKLPGTINGPLNKGGVTPLHVAVEHGHLELVEWLIEHGAEVDQLGHWSCRCTPLHIAQLARNPAMVALLKRHGARERPLPKGWSYLDRSETPLLRAHPVRRLTETDEPVAVAAGPLGKLTLVVTQDPRPEVGDTFGDDYTLTVTSADGSSCATHPFQTSYGKFEIDVLDLTRDGVPELVLLQGVGRGTSVRAERIHILSIGADGIRIVRTAPYSAFFGSGARWWYCRDYIDADLDGTFEVRLHLCHTPLGAGGRERPEAIPKAETVILEPTDDE